MRTQTFTRKPVTSMSAEKFTTFIACVTNAAKVLGDESLKQALSNLQSAYDAYQAALMLDTTSDYTEAIHAIGEKVNATWRGLYFCLKGILGGDADDSQKQFAEKVLGILAEYGFGFLYKGYGTKFGTLTYAVKALEEMDYETCQSVGIVGYIQTLDSAGDEYVVANEARNSFRKLRKNKVSATRKALNAAYSLFIKTVDVHYENNGGSDCEEFFGLMDEIMISEQFAEATKQQAAAEPSAEETVTDGAEQKSE